MKPNRKARELLVIWLCAAFGLLPFGSVAQAQDSDYLCDTIGDYTDSELEERRNWLLRTVPYRDLQAAQNTSFVTEELPEQIGPFVRKAANNSNSFEIVIPKGFRQLHCNMVAAYFATHTGSDTKILNDIIPRFKRCDEEIFDVQSCLGIAIEEQRDRIVSASTPQLEILPWVVGSALHILLLHEFAHAAQGHLDSQAGSYAESRQREFEADIYSQTWLDHNQGLALGALYNFATLSWLDLEPTESHKDYICRYEDATYIGTSISFERLVLMSAARSILMEGAIKPHNRANLAQIAADPLLNQSIEANYQRCRQDTFPDIQDYRRDLRSLIVFLDQRIDDLPPRSDHSGAIAFLSDYLDQPTASPEGKSVKLASFSLFLRHYSIEDPRVFFPIASKALALGEENYIASDLGRIIGIIGIADFHSFTMDDEIDDESTARIHATLERAIELTPEFSEAHAVDGLLYVRKNQNCELAMTRLRDGILTANIPPEENEGLALLWGLFQRFERGEDCYRNGQPAP